MEQIIFPVVKVQGHPQFDWLPVAKISRYSIEENIYRPFAQGHLCVSGEGFFVRMWAFEVTPQPDSRLRVTLQLQPEGPLLAAEVTAAGETVFTVDGNPQSSEELNPRSISGEDLQGIYWGVNLLFPHSLLERIYPGLTLEGEQEIQGNLYKLGEGKFPHRGSFLPVDFTLPDPLNEDGLGRMVIADY